MSFWQNLDREVRRVGLTNETVRFVTQTAKEVQRVKTRLEIDLEVEIGKEKGAVRIRPNTITNSDIPQSSENIRDEQKEQPPAVTPQGPAPGPMVEYKGLTNHGTHINHVDNVNMTVIMNPSSTPNAASQPKPESILDGIQ